MGLDVYFYREKNTKEEVSPDWQVTSELTPELKQLIKDLKEYSIKNEESFTECLSEAIKDFLYNHTCNNRNEILYFRKFWFILTYFNYTDDNYGMDMTITKSHLEDLKIYLENVLAKVDKAYNNLPKTKKYNSELCDARLEEVCCKELNSSDSDVYEKTKRLYNGICSMLNDTDFDNEHIVLNADW